MMTDALPSLAIIVSLVAWLWGLRCIRRVARSNASLRTVALVGGLTGLPLALLIILWL